MKRNLRLFGIMLLAITTASLTSCLSSDDEGGIDAETYKIWLTNISGHYYGDNSSWKTENKIYFYNDTISGENKADSINGIDVSFYKDSTMVIDNVPGRVLAKNIKDNDELKKAIEDASAQTLKAKFIFYNISNDIASYLVYPYEVTYPALNYKGDTHKVTIKFYGPTGGAYGYVKGKSTVAFNFCIEGVYLDNNVVPSIYDDTSLNIRQQKSILDIRATR